MRNTLKKWALVAGLLILPSVGQAGTQVGDFELSANVAITSDYVWRGVSQTNEDPAIQGGFDVGHDSGLYVGVWASNIDFGDAEIEMDLYGGFATEFANGFSLDLGAIRYFYPGSPGSKEYDFTEVYFGLGYAFETLSLSGKYSYSPDYTASTTDDSAQYVEVGAEVSLPEDFAIAAHFGHAFGSSFKSGGNLDDFSIGISKSLAGFGLDISYYGTGNDAKAALGAAAEDRVVFTVSRSF
ncbi:MAG: hypothetical protein HQL72_13155 [Magnetococcales bacterium]|nr:hypothetical protein [Magnetococcales bacterium]